MLRGRALAGHSASDVSLWTTEPRPLQVMSYNGCPSLLFCSDYSAMNPADPAAEIFVTGPAGWSRSVRLEADRVSLGRSATNTLSFPDDDGLSRRHLVLEREDDRWFVKNLASKNGTFVNGVLIRGRHYLEPGDRITASCVAMTFSGPSTGGRSVEFEAPAAEQELSAQITSLREVLSSGRSESLVLPTVARGPQVSFGSGGGGAWGLADPR
jgi:hypothetical protein